MKKILFLINNLGNGGAEKVLVNLVKHLDKSKFEITVMTLFDIGTIKQSLPDSVRYLTHYQRMPRGNSHIMKLFSPKTLHRYFVKERYDIEVAFLEGPCARIISGCEEEKTKLISWIHVEQHTIKKAAKSFRSAREMKKCYMRFDATACVSQYVFNDFTNLVKVKNPQVVYNTVESEKIISLSKAPVEEDIFQDGVLTICGIGTLKKSKGFDRLINIHARLISEGNNIRTIILGTGSEADKLKKLTKDLKVTDTVHFLGYQTNPYRFLSRSDIFVCTSYAEGFSTAATEALILGIPVCTVDVSGMREMLGENNEFGLVTKNDDQALYSQLTKLIQNEELLHEYKERSKERGKQFVTQETVKTTEEFLLR